MADAMMPYLLGVGGLLVALGAHLAAREAKSRSRKRFVELLGPALKRHQAGDWEGLQDEVGVWGCAIIGLSLLQGLGLLVAVSAGLYLVFFPR